MSAEHKELAPDVAARAEEALTRLNAVDPDLVEYLISSVDYMAQLRPMSKWSYKAGAMAMETDGVFGTLVLQIPSKVADTVEVSFHTGRGTYHSA